MSTVEVPVVLLAMLVGYVANDLFKIFLDTWRRRHD